MGGNISYGFLVPQQSWSDKLFFDICKITDKYVTVIEKEIINVDRNEYKQLNELEIVEYEYGSIHFMLKDNIEGKVLIDPQGKLSIFNSQKYKIGAINFKYEDFFLLTNDEEDTPYILNTTLPIVKEIYYNINPIIGCWWGSELPENEIQKISNCYYNNDVKIALSFLDKFVVFPPWIVDSFGKEHLRSIPHFNAEDLNDGGLLLHYPIKDFWNSNFITHLSEALDHLGWKYVKYREYELMDE